MAESIPDSASSATLRETEHAQHNEWKQAGRSDLTQTLSGDGNEYEDGIMNESLIREGDDKGNIWRLFLETAREQTRIVKYRAQREDIDEAEDGEKTEMKVKKSVRPGRQSKKQSKINDGGQKKGEAKVTRTRKDAENSDRTPSSAQTSNLGLGLIAKLYEEVSPFVNNYLAKPTWRNEAMIDSVNNRIMAMNEEHNQPAFLFLIPKDLLLEHAKRIAQLPKQPDDDTRGELKEIIDSFETSKKNLGLPMSWNLTIPKRLKAARISDII
uniref:Uncharacterized protein n=1 Tax=Talaromyces marneffei PM1 TaxID=1077442 RepID=A0A093V3W8_TALMA